MRHDRRDGICRTPERMRSRAVRNARRQLATRLLSGAGAERVQFSALRYCAVLDEDAQMGSLVVTVAAAHKQGQAVRYSITGGNKDGLFTIDQHTGVITLAAALDYEVHEKHELVVAAEVHEETVHAIVQVTVRDVNDNPPVFLQPAPQLTVIEEDDRHLPATLLTVMASDADRVDQQGGLIYTLKGDGVDAYTPADAFFTIHPRTGQLVQLRALDRDPPRGKRVWRVRVLVRDGQAPGPRQGADDAEDLPLLPRPRRQRREEEEEEEEEEDEEEEESSSPTAPPSGDVGTRREEEEEEERGLYTSRAMATGEAPSQTDEVEGMVDDDGRGRGMGDNEEEQDGTEEIMRKMKMKRRKKRRRRRRRKRRKKRNSHQQTVRRDVRSTSSSGRLSQPRGRLLLLLQQTLRLSKSGRRAAPERLGKLNYLRQRGGGGNDSLPGIRHQAPPPPRSDDGRRERDEPKGGDAGGDIADENTEGGRGSARPEVDADDLEGRERRSRRHWFSLAPDEDLEENQRPPDEDLEENQRPPDEDLEENQRPPDEDLEENQRPPDEDLEENRRPPDEDLEDNRRPPDEDLEDNQRPPDEDLEENQRPPDEDLEENQRHRHLRLRRGTSKQTMSGEDHNADHPADSRDHLVDLTDQPTHPRDHPGNDQTAGPRERPTGPRERPAGPRERPAGPRKRPNGTRERLAGPRERPASLRKRPTDPRERPAGPRQRPADPRERPAGPRKRPTGTRERLAGPRERPAGLRERPAPTRERPAGPRERPGNDIESSSGHREGATTSPSPDQRRGVEDLKLEEDNMSSRTTSPSGSRMTPLNSGPGLVSPRDLVSVGVTSPLTILTSESKTRNEEWNRIAHLDRASIQSLNVDPAPSGDIGDYRGGIVGLSTPSEEKDRVGVDYIGGNVGLSTPSEEKDRVGVDYIGGNVGLSTPSEEKDTVGVDYIGGNVGLSTPSEEKDTVGVRRELTRDARVLGELPATSRKLPTVRDTGDQQKTTTEPPTVRDTGDQRKTTTEPPTVRPQRHATQRQAPQNDSRLRPEKLRHESEIKTSRHGPSFAGGAPPPRAMSSSSSREARAATTPPLDDPEDLSHLRGRAGECVDHSVFGGQFQKVKGTNEGHFKSPPGEGEFLKVKGMDEGHPKSLPGGGRGRVHVVEMVVTVLVKDINDNPPVFPNATMYGEVQENGPIDLSVAVVSAWDADDASEGTNARLTYAIEKNVIHDRTGEAIFAVDPQSGLIRTALCCLDRETTPEYHIQVVATDGGGLKGTGTVVIRLADVNDNSPRLARQLWELEVDETWGEGPPDNSTLLEMSTVDRDTSNYFFYRVVEGSGWGWDHFGVRCVGGSGHLYLTTTLDYDDHHQPHHFTFLVQVTDQGRGGWTDPRHLASAWVSVRLRDVNDNPPQFRRPHAHVTIREDAAPGTLLAALPAHDPDMGGAQEVDYQVTGGWGALTVDAGGGVSLLRSLDREAPEGGAVGVARVIGVDRGAPPLTATATLTITVTDVNDCAPRLLPPTVLHVAEGGAPTLLGVLTATDSDVWALGHGPPFTFSLAPTNPAHVLAHISLSFDPHLDSGRGGAELWTVGALDREQVRELGVGVVVGDAGGVSSTTTVSVVVDDINDNPMMPATKTVHLCTTQGGVSDAPLGRVYVEDPDDWDLGDKTFRWRGAPHPLFSLRPEDGALHASTHLRQGRYELHFAVSDAVWGQSDVPANVTVKVRALSPEALAHATPITLTPTTPTDLTRGWTPEEGGGGLGRLLEAVESVVGKEGHTVEVVSVYGRHPPSLQPGEPSTLESTTSPSPPAPSGEHTSTPHRHDATTSPTPPAATPTDGPTTSSLPHRRISAPSSGDSSPDGTHVPAALKSPAPVRLPAKDAPPSTCVWVSVREDHGGFMDPVKLQGLLALHSPQLEEKTHLQVALLEEELLEEEVLEEEEPGSAQQPPLHHQFSAATRASTAPPLQMPSSYLKVALTTRPQAVRAQLRVRTRGPRHGLLLRLATTHQHTSAFTIYLREGVACASVSWAGRASRTVCVEGRPLGDGAWHTVRAERHGGSLVVSVDDGDDWRRNESLATPADEGMVVEPPANLGLHQSEGATVGGLPEFEDARLVGVHNDLNNSCIDDLRVSGRPLPLPPAVNSTSWGQVTTWQGLESGCTAPDACLNTTCAPPLSCVSTWGQATCRCGVGRQLVDAICEDVDECQWRPCLHGGTCYDLRPGFECVCRPGYTGQHCQWGDLATEGYPFAAPIAIAALTVSLLLLVVVGILVSLKLRRLWDDAQGGEVRAQGDEGGTVVELMTRNHTGQASTGDAHRKTLLQCLRFQLPPIHPVPLQRGKKVTCEEESCHTDSILVNTNFLVTKVAPAGVSVPLTVRGAAGVRGSIPLSSKDDLRAYAYEGDGSSAGSLTSALSGLREEQPDEGAIKPLVPGFLEAMDLLKNLPEASTSPTLLGTRLDDPTAKKKTPRESPSGQNPPSPRRSSNTNPSVCPPRRICALVSKAVRSPPATNARPAPNASPGRDSPPHSEEERTAAVVREGNSQATTRK
ncbi:uncharacterized protein [Panulirus ornatus]|uniref:uncharacterized protein n=1 Tax=Panulirus ornatus TaxID=150431 RepID=UPI003A8A3464